MVELIAKSPLDRLLPIRIGACELSGLNPEVITSVAPFSGCRKTVSDQLRAQHGVGFPGANRMSRRRDVRCVWFGPDLAMLIGPAPGRLDHAALSDQSDGWVVMQLCGAGAEDVLARLIPLDLRQSCFKRGHTARSLLNHMAVSVTRTGVDCFDIMVFRSMAQTAVHELERTMKITAALIPTGD